MINFVVRGLIETNYHEASKNQHLLQPTSLTHGGGLQDQLFEILKITLLLQQQLQL